MPQQQHLRFDTPTSDPVLDHIKEGPRASVEERKEHELLWILSPLRTESG